MGPAPSSNRARLAAATAAVALLGSLALSEVTLRVIRPQAVGVARLPAVYDRDPVLGYRYRPGARGRIHRMFELDNTVVINAEGFHDIEWGPLTGPRPVVALGDSFTAALHVPVEQTWTRAAEARLARSASRARRVLNLGLDGSGTGVQLALLEENLGRVKPGLVLLAFFENDLADLRRGRVYRETRGRYVLQPRDEAEAGRMRELADDFERRRLARALFEGLYTVRLGVHLARGDRNLWRTNVISPFHLGAFPPAESGSAGASPLAPGTDARTVLRALQDLARKRGFRVLVVPVPPREAPGRSLAAFRRAAGDLEFDVEDVQAALLRVLERDGRRFSDLYWRWDAHFNAYGNAVFGEVVADALAGRLAGEAPASGSSPSRTRNVRP